MLKEVLSKEFKIRDLGEPEYYLGIKFSRENDAIAIHQRGYVKKLWDRFGMTKLKPVSTPVDINVNLTKPEYECTSDEKKLPYRELVGALMYLFAAARPGIRSV
ncbi:uncharacterized mitochondrial protein AtMg00810-like [Belonocnema kinseyi]|uniref:uncharacterized mitochondrial protein AtMg00810-like n=1 Tax=Belonocnema kinseyi TaxID=2817044 RepID=UPI00143D1D66|nr:uncharacterized mitochondrial protein AtMg00810-like [Belonocnema kinseyi]